VASRSSEVNFTKNYTLLYLFFFTKSALYKYTYLYLLPFACGK